MPRYTLTKQERLCGRNDINSLISGGKSGEVPGILRFRHIGGTGRGFNRIMVSVPKRSFKRAVRRNLLKRRIRESYRLQKHGLNVTGTDILIVYSAKEILPYADIYAAVERMIAKINARAARPARSGGDKTTAKATTGTAADAQPVPDRNGRSAGTAETRPLPDSRTAETRPLPDSRTAETRPLPDGRPEAQKLDGDE